MLKINPIKTVREIIAEIRRDPARAITAVLLIVGSLAIVHWIASATLPLFSPGAQGWAKFPIFALLYFLYETARNWIHRQGHPNVARDPDFQRQERHKNVVMSINGVLWTCAMYGVLLIAPPEVIMESLRDGSCPDCTWFPAVLYVLAGGYTIYGLIRLNGLVRERRERARRARPAGPPPRPPSLGHA
jgi:hypothetical protein